MNSTLLNPDAGADRPIFKGDPADSVYLDDDTDFIDDVSSNPPDVEDESVWSVDTGAGEFTAPVDQRGVAP
ncbi:MAG TPA: hypothetical protein VGM51_13910 [Armatimonadota bacterium]|jgi:hypothetical protein